ncbi:MAG TPA: magnesium/cobalt transporter CorA [Flavobacterium sp.]|nr:magnesium/cobalt transporter CorA [Flavobacterium sp.]
MTNYSNVRRVKYKEVRRVQPNYFEYTGNYKTDPVAMQLFVYNDEGFEEYNNVSLQKVKKELEDRTQEHDVKWLNLHGLHNVELVKSVGEYLGVENHILGDILNTSRRSRMEELDDILFFSIKSILQKEDPPKLEVEQISFLMKDNLLVSFQEKKSDFFAHIRERIRTGAGIVRKKKNDYLLYLLLDAVMENFYITLEHYEDRIENLLTEAKTTDKKEIPQLIEKNRENLNFLKRSILPLRDALFTLKSIQEDDDYDGIEKANYTFFARLHQKSLELLEQIEYDMNALESASNIFFSTQNQRMNQIMKTLTIFSGVFMPLTFIVGVYGMNFDNMPELRAHNGYYITWAVMIVIAAILVVYFKMKKWF